MSLVGTGDAYSVQLGHFGKRQLAELIHCDHTVLIPQGESECQALPILGLRLLSPGRVTLQGRTGLSMHGLDMPVMKCHIRQRGA